MINRHAAALAAIAGVAACFGPPPVWWLGLGLVVTAASLASAELRVFERFDSALNAETHFSLARSIRAAGYPALLFLIAALMLDRAVLGDRPSSGDHTAHFYNFHYLMTELLPRGVLHGWSNDWFAGNPAGYLYAFGAYLWAAGFKIATLGLLNYEQTYAIAFFAAFYVSALSVYCLGTFTFSRSAGFVAAVLFMTMEGSGEHHGGWEFYVRVGVWPNMLSVALSTFALMAFIRIIEERSWRQVGWFSLTAGVSVLTHPLQFLNLPLMLGSAALIHAERFDFRRLLPQASRLLAATALSVALSAAFILPFLSARGGTYTHGSAWNSLITFGGQLASGESIEGMWVISFIFGAFGIVTCLRENSLRAFLCGFLVLLYLATASTEGGFILQYLLRQNVEKVEMSRFITLLLPFWYVAAARAILRVLGKAVQRREDGAMSAGSFLRILAGASLAAPIAASFCSAFYHTQIQRHLFHRAEPAQRTVQQLAEWINSEASKDDRFFRVALLHPYHATNLLDLGAYVKVPVYKGGWTPGAGFRYKLGQFTPRTLELLSVRYIVTTEDRYLLLREVELAAGFHSGQGPEPSLFKPLQKYGEIFIVEFLGWRPQRYEILEGSGTIEMQKFEDEEIIFEAGPDSKGKLLLALSVFDRWHAERNGTPIEISSTQVEDDRSAFVTLDLAPGRYRLFFKRRWPEIMGPLLSLVALIISVLLTVYPPRHARKAGSE